MRLPTDHEARYLRQLSQGMLPEYDFPAKVLNAMRAEGWVYAARWGHDGTAWMAMGEEGAAALQQLDRKGDK